LSGGIANVTIYWGTTDGGPSAGNWSHSITLSTQTTGAFSSNITGLSPNTSYYYRCYAQNSSGSDWADSSSRVLNLLGYGDVHANEVDGDNYILFSKYTAVASGNITCIMVDAAIAGNIKVAIYTDNNGAPGTLLNANNNDSVLTQGWNAIPIASTPVVSGTVYWIAFITDTHTVGWENNQSVTGIMQYLSTPYSGFTFPSSAPVASPYYGYHLVDGRGVMP
jgi:hypothetical protein